MTKTPGEWVAEDPDPDRDPARVETLGVVRQADGATVRVNQSWTPGRLTLLGSGRGEVCVDGRHKVTVARDTTIDRIVRAIRNRLFPGFLPAYAEALRWWKERKADEAERLAQAQAIVSLDSSFQSGEFDGVPYVYISLGSVHGKLEFRPGGARLELSNLTGEQALALAWFIQSVVPEEGGI